MRQKIHFPVLNWNRGKVHNIPLCIVIALTSMESQTWCYKSWLSFTPRGRGETAAMDKWGKDEDNSSGDMPKR